MQYTQEAEQLTKWQLQYLTSSKLNLQGMLPL